MAWGAAVVSFGGGTRTADFVLLRCGVLVRQLTDCSRPHSAEPFWLESESQNQVKSRSFDRLVTWLRDQGQSLWLSHYVVLETSFCARLRWRRTSDHARIRVLVPGSHLGQNQVKTPVDTGVLTWLRDQGRCYWQPFLMCSKQASARIRHERTRGLRIDCVAAGPSFKSWPTTRKTPHLR